MKTIILALVWLAFSLLTLYAVPVAVGFGERAYNDITGRTVRCTGYRGTLL